MKGVHSASCKNIASWPRPHLFPHWPASFTLTDLSGNTCWFSGFKRSCMEVVHVIGLFWSMLFILFLSNYDWQLTFSAVRAVKKFLSGRLITNSRRLWNSHQRHKFLRTEASKDILEFRVSETLFPGVFKRYFSIADAMLLRQNTRKTGNDAVKVSQAFHNMAWFERFTDLDLFNIRSMSLIIIIRWYLFFVTGYGRRRWK